MTRDLSKINPKENIIIKGAKLHNLKNIDVVIPRNKLVVITGLSGSGKSSLAFDTLYAERLMVKDQIENDVRNLIEELPDDQKEVLMMRIYKDMSFKEIADRTDVSINTALGRMRYALINLRKVIEKHNIVLTN